MHPKNDDDVTALFFAGRKSRATGAASPILDVVGCGVSLPPAVDMREESSQQRPPRRHEERGKQNVPSSDEFTSQALQVIVACLFRISGVCLMSCPRNQK